VEDKYYKIFIDRITDGFNSWDFRLPDPDGEQLKEEMKKNAFLFFANEYTRYTIATKDGVIIGSDYTNDTIIPASPGTVSGALLQSDNFIKAMTGKIGDKQILESYQNKEFFDYARPIGDYILYFRYYSDDWSDMIASFNRIILTSLVIGFAVAFIFGLIFSRTITAPIKTLMNKAVNLAAGDFDKLPEVKSDDEIGRLTKAFNNMAVSLKNTLTTITSEKNKIEAIINYMTDGIVAFNLKGEVILINPASKKMLGEENCRELYKKYSLDDVLYLEAYNTKEYDITVGDKTIKAYFVVFTGENNKAEGVIAVLHDITEQQKLEKMRKDFVANVSHELRTPLTSIKSYAETLLEGCVEDKEDIRRFLSVINSETDRMTRIVRDLLELSRLDSHQMQWNIKEISFEDLVRDAVEKMRMESESKGLVLNSYVLGDIPDIEADYGRIQQVVFNIIGNSIKYTPEGGEITVYIGRSYNEVYMKVSDTGIGIPKEDIPRIFERFYRVDKARSRDLGGTGLGMAIAKEIVEAHSGTISLTSEPGKGTEVTVRLPVRQTRKQ